MSSSKRPSTIPAKPPPTSLSSSITIADNASLTGTHQIQIGSHTVIHPRAKLTSAHASIKIGSNCIISERSHIGMQSSSREGVTIGDGVVVEVGAIVEGASIGDGCVVEVNARIGKGARLGKHCKIGPLCEVEEGEDVPDFTVIFGNGLRRIDRGGVEAMKLKMVGRQVEVLKKLIPSNITKYQ